MSEDNIANTYKHAEDWAKDAAESLFSAIAHGDSTHRAWLKEALVCFFSGRPVPPPRGGAAPVVRETARYNKTIDAKNFNFTIYDDGVMTVVPRVECGVDLIRFDAVDVAALRALLTEGQPFVPTPEGIAQMVTRFLCWKLPETFNPDCGILFAPARYDNGKRVQWPTGTNLFDAQQAEAMVRHMVEDEGRPVPPHGSGPGDPQ